MAGAAIRERDDLLEAARLLGRLEGTFATLDAEGEAHVALALVRRLLITALRDERHEFTDQRFDAWFAGAVTLAEASPRPRRSARAIVLAVLMELGHSPWDALADAARLIERAFLGLRGENDEETAAAATEELGEARKMAMRVVPWGAVGLGGLFTALCNLAGLARATPMFATAERSLETNVLGMTVEADRLATPIWALSITAGTIMKSAGFGRRPLPCPALFDPQILRPVAPMSPDLSGRRGPLSLSSTMAVGLLRSLRHLDECLAARQTAGKVAAFAAARTSAASRLPRVAGVLAAFGPMRSSQLESTVGVTRIGLRKIVETGKSIRILRTFRVQGIVMIDALLPEMPRVPGGMARDHAPWPGISAALAEEIEDAGAFADRILARYDRGTFASPDIDEDGE